MSPITAIQDTSLYCTTLQTDDCIVYRNVKNDGDTDGLQIICDFGGRGGMDSEVTVKL